MYFPDPSLLLTFFQIFKEAATFRDAMKVLGRDIVQDEYYDALNPYFDGGNQLELDQIIIENVEKLLEGGAYLQDGKDEQVCVSFPAIH